MSTVAAGSPGAYQGNDRLLFGLIMGVIAFWLFAQTTLNVAPDMQKDLGLDASMMNSAVAITALFSGIFIVVIGGLQESALEDLSALRYVHALSQKLSIGSTVDLVPALQDPKDLFGCATAAATAANTVKAVRPVLRKVA